MRVYKLETDFGMGSCIFPSLDEVLVEARLFLEEDEGCIVTVTSLEMSEEDYVTLPEFQGW